MEESQFQEAILSIIYLENIFKYVYRMFLKNEIFMLAIYAEIVTVQHVITSS